jgi:hypothetical protein
MKKQFNLFDEVTTEGLFEVFRDFHEDDESCWQSVKEAKRAYWQIHKELNE